MAQQGVYIAGLTEFRAALRAAAADAPQVLSGAIRKAGGPIVQESEQITPRLSGRLASGYSVQVRGTSGWIVNRTPYAAGAHWGAHGKWTGFARYGPPGERLAGKAIDDKAEETLTSIYEDIFEIASAYGWMT